MTEVDWNWVADLFIFNPFILLFVFPESHKIILHHYAFILRKLRCLSPRKYLLESCFNFHEQLQLSYFVDEMYFLKSVLLKSHRLCFYILSTFSK